MAEEADTAVHKTQAEGAQPRFEVLEDRAVPAVLMVTAGTGNYPTIMSAVNAARTGDIVLVEPGIYVEQVTITKSITLEGAHSDRWHNGNWFSLSYDNGTQSDWNNDYNDNASTGNVIIKAPTTLTGPIAATGTTPQNPDAIVHVTGNGVTATIEHLTIEGASSSGTPNLYFGVRVDNGATGEIEDNVITNIIDSSDPSLGVAVDFGSSTLTSDGTAPSAGGGDCYHNTITNYNRAGVVVSNTGSWADVSDNLIVAAPTQADSQTGVEVSFGAAAQVNANVISGNMNGSNGTGVLLFEPGTTVTLPNTCSHLSWQNNCGFQNSRLFFTTVANNVITGNDIGTAGSGQLTALIIGNISSNNTYNGIWLDSSSGVTVSSNLLSCNGGNNFEDGGIALTGSTSNFLLNNISSNNNGSGVFLDAGAAGNLVEGNYLNGNVYNIALDSADAVDLSTGNQTAGTANTWISNTAANSITVSGQSLTKSKPKNFGGFGW